MSDQRAKAIRSKVKAYPFEATLEMNSQKTRAEVIFLNFKGVIVRLDKQIVYVGDYFQVTFQTPLNREWVSAQVRVLKTYDKAIDLKGKTVERLAELHFQELTKEARSRINAFVAAVGQESK